VGGGGLRTPGFRLVKAGAKLEPREYTVDLPWRPRAFTGTADVARVASEFADGATMVLQALHHTWPPLARFCRELERELEHPVQANAYFTPRGSQGLPVHHDTHDVLVLQVAGHKRWLVYEPALELPLKHQRYRRELGEPGDPVHDLVLRPGDTLYLPRGWLHEALTSDADSLHLTLGLNVTRWVDALRDALDDCELDVEFRRSVPADGTMTVDLLERLRPHLSAPAVARRRRARFVRTRRPILDDQLQQVRALDELTAETIVERRSTVIADLERADDRALLAFEGKTVDLPARIWEELVFLVSAEGPFRPRDLPGRLDGESRLVLVRRLVREGFLRVAPRTGVDAEA
jgi:JmjC domain